MKLARLFLAVSVALSAPSAASAGAWKPTGPWAADYGDDYCRLARFFTDGKDQVALIMERTQPGPFFRVILVGDGVKTYRRADTLGLQFTPQAVHNAFIMRSKSSDGQQYLDLGLNSVMPPPAPPTPGAPPAFKPYVPQEERASAKQIGSIGLSSGMVEPMTFETGVLDAPIGALQKCTSDLIKQWGVDPARQEKMTKPAMPVGKVSDWVPSGTYPFTEFRKLAGGVNVIRVMIDEAGKPTSCVVQRPSVDASYNKTACDSIMKKASFTPALDAAGQPMPSFWLSEVMGLLPPFPGAR